MGIVFFLSIDLCNGASPIPFYDDTPHFFRFSIKIDISEDELTSFPPPRRQGHGMVLAL